MRSLFNPVQNKTNNTIDVWLRVKLEWIGRLVGILLRVQEIQLNYINLMLNLCSLNVDLLSDKNVPSSGSHSYLKVSNKTRH